MFSETPCKNLYSLRTVGILIKFQKMHIFTKIFFNHETNGMIEECSWRAFQWMVKSIGFDHFGIFKAISECHTWWQKSPSALKELTL
jgi:hypothetical protein